MTPDPAPANPIAALADSVRALIDTVRVLEDSVPPLDCARAASLVREAEDLLHGFRNPGPYAQAGHGFNPLSQLPPSRDPAVFFEMSPIVGPRNPIAPPVRMWATDDGHVHGEATIGAAYNGPPGLVHGGVIALIFDELLGCTGVVNGVGGYTGTLSVRYRLPTPLFTPLSMEASIDRIEGRKVFIVGEIRYGDTLTATAEGIFIVSRPEAPSPS
jgi:acyl-coenzyme A thioesterase PaaI-like protein